MRAYLIITFAVATLWPKGCHTVPTPPPPANVASAPALAAASTQQQSKAAAAVAAATAANDANPPGPAQVATAGELSVAQASLPAPADADRAEALARVNAALTGRLDEAQQGWAKARTDAAALADRVKALEEQVAAERTAAAAELKRQLDEARSQARKEAEAKERLLITAIFFGVGALLILGAAAVLFLRAQVPIFGPQVAIWLGAAGMALILTGIIVRAVERLIEDHPFIFWGGITAAVLAVVASVVLMIANHHHQKAP